MEQQLANNNVNAGGSFIEAGLQQVNVRAIGLVDSDTDIERTVIKTQSGTPIRIQDIATVEQGSKIRLGRNGKAIHRADGRIIDNDDVVEGIVLLRKGAEAEATLKAIEAKVYELNHGILPPGVTVVPFLDRSELVHHTTRTVLHNLTVGIILVTVILFLFLGNARGALIVALTIPFSLLFASICLDLRKIPANLLSLGALDFGMVVDGAVVMVENIVRHMAHRDPRHRTTLETIRDAAHEVQRPVFYAISIIITAYVPIFTLQRVEGRLFKPMAWTVAFALLGFAVVFAFSIVVTAGVAIAALAGAGYLAFSGVIGSEFLPHLDEGDIWVRGTLAPSTGPTEGIRLADQARVILASFPEVLDTTSQVGRPDDGTDTTGFFNTEYFVHLKQKEQWRPVFREDKEEARKDAGRDMEFLAAHCRQHGGGRERSEGRARGETVWRRSEAPREQSRPDGEYHARN